ncbi:beta-eliminating lyase-related protein [Sphaerisporangium sp. TRM90804]|uniref:threonine aldolase family protein n=1 Tax=Sphaerisporangium sp. TRM90804 TaxID=3031113 RepID=UPI0024474905|nr:beta-eliminating lyase-related protein [Sphaerisporangium sp. TRM90804]MDH2424663.1 beta-eliminating lyase-related protein [Sphaerisporangium sp. TRM90804]
MTDARRRHDPEARSFASDNYAGVHPEIMRALAQANGGHQVAYGGDVYTEAVREVFRRHFGPQAEVWPVFNGTGANVVGLRAMTAPWEAVVCARTAHIHVDEGGAPEQAAGLKLWSVPTPDGKLTPELVGAEAWGFGDEHRAQPKVVSISQSTELGTLYTPGEIAAVAAHCHGLGMLLHMDGSRLTIAAAALGVPLRALTTDAGVDVLSFGGTKHGLMFGEAVVVLNPGAARGVIYLRKSSMQLASKMRFVSAQFEALLAGDLWLRNARNANAMAARLARAVSEVPGVTVSRPVEANAVFAVLPPDAADRLRKRFRFYTWDETTGEVRWMTAFDTTEADVDAFAAALAEEMASGPPGREG